MSSPVPTVERQRPVLLQLRLQGGVLIVGQVAETQFQGEIPSIHRDGIEPPLPGVVHIQVQPAHHLLSDDAGFHQEDLVGQVGRGLGDAELPEGLLRPVVAQGLDQDGRRPFIDGDLVVHIERSGKQGHGQGEGEPVPVPEADAQDALQEDGRGSGRLPAGRRGGGVSHSFHITCFG